MPERQFDRIAADIYREGRTVFPFRTMDLIPEIIAGFENLLNEPKKVRELWEIDRSRFEAKEADRAQGVDDGLIVRTGSLNSANGDTYDKKCFLHFKLGIPLLLESRGVNLWRHPWISACEQLHRRCLMEMLRFAEAVDRAKPGLHLYEQMSSRAAMSMHALRLLWYSKPDVKEGCLVGDGHVDRCTFTIHVADSRPVLYLVDPPNVPELYTAWPDHGLLFTSGKAPMIDREFKMCAHEIRDRSVENGNQRWSIVFFGHTDTPLHPSLEKSRRISADHPETVPAAAAAS